MLWQRGKAYPQELRERVFACADSGMPVGAIASALLVSVSYVCKVLSRREKTGERAARAQRCHLVPRLHEHAGRIKERVQARPDSTLAELCAWLEEEQAEGKPAADGEDHGQAQPDAQKRRCTRPNRIGQMWRSSARPGGRRSPRLT